MSEYRGPGRPPGQAKRNKELEARDVRVDFDQNLYENILNASPIKSEIAKQVAARSLVILIQQQRDLSSRIATGIATVEEHKLLPPNASNIKRYLELLGLTELDDGADLPWEMGEEH